MAIGDSASVIAARTVAAEHGVRCDDSVVIAAGSNVLVHLKPSPVVARVMTGTAALHDDTARWLEREVAVGVFVADQGGPVVPPSVLLAPGPYQHDGLWMTFWKFVAHDPTDRSPDPRAVGRALRELHGVLARFVGDLEPFSGIGDQIELQLSELRPCAWLSEHEIELLRSELRRLTPKLFETSAPVQPLHGDAGLSNLLHSRARLLWKDLEDVCQGPVGWDVAGVVASALSRARSEKYLEKMLSAYGGPGLDELQAFLDLDALYGTVWQAFDTQRRRPTTTTPPKRLAQWLGQLARQPSPSQRAQLRSLRPRAESRIGDHALAGSTLSSDRVQTVLALRDIGEVEDVLAQTRLRSREAELGITIYGPERAALGASAPLSRPRCRIDHHD